MKQSVSIIGCGFVADLYMRSFETFPEIEVLQVFDQDTDRLRAFCAHWKIKAAPSLNALLAAHPANGVILNLTNPDAHYELNKICLNAGHHVYCEKPLAMLPEQAFELGERAKDAGVILASAPCSVLGEAAQVLAQAVRSEVAGTARLIYAELDDGFISQAPYKGWLSESGAPWPYRDEFHVGCTLEHAGYYLTWLIAMFGSVKTVVAASAEVVPDKEGGPYGTADFSVATLFFEDGPVARLTCSIVAPHDHQIRVIADDGVLSVKQAWSNSAKVRFNKRLRIRRRLLESPFAKVLKPSGETHPKVGRWGAASMNFALGPVEVLQAINEARPCRLSTDFAVHLTEVTLAIQNAKDTSGAQVMQSSCARMELMPWAG